MYIQRNKIEFEWSDEKDQQNYWKHDVWFEEAKTIWKDPLAIEFFDFDHSELEDRFIAIGHSSRGRILFVVFHEREEGRLIRIVSARIVTLKERFQYEEGI